MRILPVGDAALLVEPAAEGADPDAALRAVLALHAALEADPPLGVVELVPAARTVLVRFRPGGGRADARGATTASALSAALLELRPDATAPPEGPLVTLPARYDGEDLDAVAALLDLSREALVARHSAPEYRVAFVGFAPGFGYLAGGDPRLVVPRRDDPRPRIPAGSVAIAGGFSGVYPRASPGGWQLLGSTDAVLWDERHDPPALLRPGTRVRFEPIRSTARLGVAAEPAPVRSSPVPASGATRPAGAVGARALEVLHPGGRSLLQDLGRPGMAALGVAPAGALDCAAVRRVNRIVGAPADAAVIEHVLGGLRLRARGRMLVAVVGAEAPVTIDGEPADRDRALLLDDGAELGIGAPSRGAAVLVGAHGGIDIPPVLGSRSRDTLASLGPAPLAAGDLLPIGPVGRTAAALQESGPRLPAPGDVVELELLPGPRADWFEPEALRRLLAAPWTVSPRSDRIALRLEGPDPLVRRTSRSGELASEGLVRGAVQVPPDGRPVLFLADHPLTGGYPVIGVIAPRSLDLAAQCPPGTVVRFTQGVAHR
ncbi:MAG: urea amidolyase family protein [Microbacteriaceae bacterium]